MSALAACIIGCTWEATTECRVDTAGGATKDACAAPKSARNAPRIGGESAKGNGIRAESDDSVGLRRR